MEKSLSCQNIFKSIEEKKGEKKRKRGEESINSNNDNEENEQEEKTKKRKTEGINVLPENHSYFQFIDTCSFCNKTRSSCFECLECKKTFCISDEAEKCGFCDPRMKTCNCKLPV